MKPALSSSLKLAVATVFFCSFATADEPHYRILDDFTTLKKWTSETIEPNYNSPFFHAGVWSKPIDGPTVKIVNGKGYFHFPQLESWPNQGFEYAYHTDNAMGYGLRELDGTNYFSVDIENKSSEPVWIKFRLLGEITYNYKNTIETIESLCELKTEPDSFVIKPNTAAKNIMMKIVEPEVATKDVTNPVFKEWIKFFAFETRRTVSSSKAKPTLDCTLIMDNMKLCDSTANQK